MDNAAGLLAGFLVLALSLAIYFIPTLVAFERLRRNRGAILRPELVSGLDPGRVARRARLGLDEPGNRDGTARD